MARFSQDDMDIDALLRRDLSRGDSDAFTVHDPQSSPSVIASSEMLGSPHTLRFNGTFASELDDADYYTNMDDDGRLQHVRESQPHSHELPPSYDQYRYYDEGHEQDPRRSFEFSQPRVSTASNGERGSDVGAALNDGAPRLPHFTRGSILMDRDIEALTMSPGSKKERKRDYKGRYRIWPGLLFLVALLGGAAFGITHFAIEKRTASQSRQQDYALRKYESKSIQSNSSKGGAGSVSTGGDLIEDDGVIGNPKKYPPSACELPDYQSKQGKIYAVSKNGTEVAIGMKGINWFGMETYVMLCICMYQGGLSNLKSSHWLANVVGI